MLLGGRAGSICSLGPRRNACRLRLCLLRCIAGIRCILLYIRFLCAHSDDLACAELEAGIYGWTIKKGFVWLSERKTCKRNSFMVIFIGVQIGS